MGIAVFIDYDNLFWGHYNIYNQVPDIIHIIGLIKNKGNNFCSIQAFGDFTKPEMQRERMRLRGCGIQVIDCAAEGLKDYTDFIMLDAIFNVFINQKGVNTFVLVTGDQHFSSVVETLRHRCNKEVGVISLQGTTSRGLSEAANWFIEITATKNELNNSKNLRKKLIDTILFVQKRGIFPSFSKTIEKCSQFNKEDPRLLTIELSEMIREGLIAQEKINLPNGKEAKVLVLDQEKMKKELLQ